MFERRAKTCCFSGHRAIPEKERELLSQQLEEAIISTMEKGYRYFKTGGALGFDLLAADTVLRLKKRGHRIKLILVLPCKTQTKYWKDDDKAEYERIKRQADRVIYTAKDYYQGCMHQRNRALVDGSSFCICYLTSQRGGTAYTVRYAKEQGVTVMNLAQARTPLVCS